MKSMAPMILAVLGVLLLGLSFAWGSLFPAKSSWTEEKSNQLSELGAEANLLRFAIVESEQQPSGDPRKDPEYLQAQYDQVIEKYEALQREFESARDTPKTMGGTLKWVAIGCIGVAAIVLLVQRQES